MPESCFSAHSNTRETHFSSALKKYGKDNFIWEVIDRTDNKEDLCKLERLWIFIYQSYDRNIGYNHTLGGDGGSEQGRIFSENYKKKMSESSKGEKNGMFGKKHTEDSKNKIREFRKKNPISRNEKGQFIKNDK